MIRPARVPRQVCLLFVMMLLTFGCGETSLPTGPSLSSPARGSVGFSTPPSTPRVDAVPPPLTIAEVAASLALETNASFDAALRASLGIASLETTRPETYFASLINLLLPTPVYAQTFGGFAPCRTAGSVTISGDATPSGRRVSLRGVQVSYSTCSYPLVDPINNRSVTFSGTMTVDGIWSADDPANPVTMIGSLDVNEIGPVEISCTSLSTEAGCNGNVGGITTGAPDTLPPPNPTPSPCPTPVPTPECPEATPEPMPAPTPAPTPGGINVTGTWVASGQPGAIAMVQHGTAISCNVLGLPGGMSQVSCGGTINGSNVSLTQVLRVVVSEGGATGTCNAVTVLSLVASNTTMTGSFAGEATCTFTAPGGPPLTVTTPGGGSATLTRQ
jgi:hypothetical protein